MIKFIRQSWLVLVSALAFGLLVAGVNAALEGKIAENARLKKEKALKTLLTDATSFETITDDEGNMVYSVGKDSSGNIAGYALIASGGGFADKIELLVAFDSEIKILKGFYVLKSQETPGFGDKITHESKPGEIGFKKRFQDRPIDNKLIVIKSGNPKEHTDDNTIVAITGATITSEAVTKIVNDAAIKMKKLLEK